MKANFKGLKLKPAKLEVDSPAGQIENLENKIKENEDKISLLLQEIPNIYSKINTLGSAFSNLHELINSLNFIIESRLNELENTTRLITDIVIKQDKQLQQLQEQINGKG